MPTGIETLTVTVSLRGRQSVRMRGECRQALKQTEKAFATAVEFRVRMVSECRQALKPERDAD